MAVGAFRDLERSYFDLRWHLDPVAATEAGLTAHDGRLGRFSPPALAPHLAALRSIAAALEEASTADLCATISGRPGAPRTRSAGSTTRSSRTGGSPFR